MPLWAPSAVVSSEWGTFRIVVGGKRVTRFRGAETVVTGWSDQEPYGFGPAALVFPAITELDEIGAGDLSWLSPWPSPPNVDIYKVNPDGSRAAGSLYSGFVEKLTLDAQTNDGALTVHLAGCVQGSLALKRHSPKQTYRERDLGAAMIYRMRFPGMRFQSPAIVETGITTRKRGSRSQSVLEWCDEILAIAMTDDGDQWTFRRVPTEHRRVELVLKDRTTVDATVHAGARGVALQLEQDPTQEPNRIFGEGVGPAGDRWRNLVAPNLKPETVPPYPGTPLDIGSTGDSVRIWQGEVSSDGYEVGDEFAIKSGEFGELEADAAREIQRKAGLSVTGIVNAATWAATWANGVNSANLGGIRFDPLAADPRTVRYLTTSNGSLSEANPDYDGKVLPVETLISYGEGISKRKARKSARSMLTRTLEGPGWLGRITLTADPIEMHRLDLRAGMNIRVKFALGETAGLLFHIADVSPDLTDLALPVTLTVDTKARDLLTIAEIMERNRETKEDPARSFINQRRASTRVRDTVVGWDRESGMGQIPARDLVGGQWNVIPILSAQFGSIIETKLTVDPPCKFAAATFGKRVHVSQLTALNPTPLTSRSDNYEPWDDPDIQDQVGDSNRTGIRLSADWGREGQAAGYWPGEEEKGHEPTGVLKDTASWDYISADPPWIWLAVWPESDCELEGRLKQRVDE